MSNYVNPETVPQKTLADGSKIPCIGMGTFGSDRFSPEQVSAAVAGSIRAGYRLFDCAAVYGNEVQIGKVFKSAYDEGVVKREELTIMSKVWNNMHQRVEASCRKSIEDLQADYIDILFIHWPFPNYHAPGCDVDARNPDSKPFSTDEYISTYHQIEKLVKQGLVKKIGLSNITIPKLEAVLPFLEIAPVVSEIELHPAFQQKELFNYLLAHKIQPIGYMPIGSPRRPERDMTETDIADIELPEMKAIAEAHGIHPAVAALKWAVQRGQIPIPFSIHEANYISNLRATTEDLLTDEEMEMIATLEKNNRLVKGQVFLWENAKDWHDLWDEDGIIVK